MSRVVAISLVATDRMSRTFDNASGSVNRLQGAFDKLEKVGKLSGLATAAAGAVALTNAAAPAAAAVLALPAAFAAMKVATTTAKVGLQGVGEAMKEVASGDAKKLKEALKDLSPAAAAFVKETAGIQKSWKGIQKSVQENMFKGLASQLKPMADNLLPSIKLGMNEVGEALGFVASRAMSTASNPWFKGEVAKIFSGTAQAVRTLAGGVQPLLRIVARLASLGMPVINTFIQWGVNGLEAADSWMSGADAMAKMDGWLRTGLAKLQQLANIVKNLVGTLAGVVKQAGSFNVVGVDMLTTLEQLTAKMNESVNSAEGAKTWSEMFRALGDVMSQLMIIMPVFSQILKIISGIITGMPEPVRGVVIQMLAWSIILGVVANKLKLLMLAAGGLKFVSSSFKMMGTAVRGIAAAPGMIAGFAAGFRNVNAAFSNTANAGTTLGAAIRSQLQLWRQQAAAMAASAKQATLNAAAWVRMKAVAAGSWIMAQVTALRAAAAAQLANARAAMSSALATARQKLATVASTVASVAARAATIAWTAVQWLLNAALTANPIGLIVAAIALLVGAIILAYKNSQTFRTVVSAAWAGIKQAVSVAWGFIKVVFDLIKQYVLRVLIPQFKMLWSVTKAVFTGVWTAVRSAWGYISPIFTAIKNAVINGLIIYFKTYWSAIKLVWAGVTSVIRGAWNSVISPTFNAMKRGVDLVRQAFRIAVDGIRTVWDRLRGYTKAPISFFVNTVYMGGVRKVWEGVRKLVPALPGLPALKFATGGTVPGYAPGRDSVLAMLSPGEGILRPEATRALGEGFITRANKAAKSGGVGAVHRVLGGVGDPGGMGIPGFKNGGIVDIIKKPVNWIKNAGGSIMEKGVNWFAKSILDPIKARIPGGAGMWAQAMTSLPRQMIDGFLNWIKTKIAPVWGGGGNNKAVQAARSMIGTPYSWGGGGPHGPSRGIERGANTVGFDCSSLMQYGWYQATRKVMPRTTYTQKPWLRKVSNPVPGAIGQPHPGHTFMYSGNGKIIEAPYTGGFVREVPMRSASFWGLPPWKMDAGGALPPNSMSLINNASSRSEMVMTGAQQDLIRAAIDNGAGQTVNLTVNLPVGSNPMQAAKQIADLLREYRRRGGVNPFA